MHIDVIYVVSGAFEAHKASPAVKRQLKIVDAVWLTVLKDGPHTEFLIGVLERSKVNRSCCAK
jgi:hypothetical protein